MMGIIDRAYKKSDFFLNKVYSWDFCWIKFRIILKYVWMYVGMYEVVIKLKKLMKTSSIKTHIKTKENINQLGSN